jgi:hypothetical protein
LFSKSDHCNDSFRFLVTKDGGRRISRDLIAWRGPTIRFTYTDLERFQAPHARLGCYTHFLLTMSTLVLTQQPHRFPIGSDDGGDDHEVTAYTSLVPMEPLTTLHHRARSPSSVAHVESTTTTTTTRTKSRRRVCFDQVHVREYSLVAAADVASPGSDHEVYSPLLMDWSHTMEVSYPINAYPTSAARAPRRLTPLQRRRRIQAVTGLARQFEPASSTVPPRRHSDSVLVASVYANQNVDVYLTAFYQK